jgi:hypothetical protein
MFELVIILYLIIKARQVKQDLKFSGISRDKLKTMKRSNIDMNNLMHSINNSKELYKQLSKACHPDRFINTEFEQKANDIFQEISKNKRDFNALSKLKERAKKELNINI